MQRVDDYVELKFTGTEDYDQCAHKALESLSIEVDESQEEACLYRMNGSKVPDEPIVDEDGVECPWTLARYLECVSETNTV